jgi:hypothetical protein
MWKKRGCRTGTRNPDAELGRGEWGGGNNAKLNNSSTVQHFDVGFKMKIANTFLLIALTKCADLLLASLALSRLHYIKQATTL